VKGILILKQLKQVNVFHSNKPFSILCMELQEVQFGNWSAD